MRERERNKERGRCIYIDREREIKKDTYLLMFLNAVFQMVSIPHKNTIIENTFFT